MRLRRYRGSENLLRHRVLAFASGRTVGVLLILASGAQTADWLWSRLIVSDQALTLRKICGTMAYPWSTIERVEVEAKS